MKVLLVVACCLGLAHAVILWGTATAAYQVEGYRSVDGRQPSIWDAFDTPNTSSLIKAMKPNGKPNIFEGMNAATADRDYTLYPNSVALTKEYGFGAARLSISWPRVMTYSKQDDGKGLSWSRNEMGIKHYKMVLEEYKRQGVQAAVTMFHWDLPLAIEEVASAQGCGSAWLCHDLITTAFADYAELLLSEYGQLVDWWITLNEPLTVVSGGYVSGGHAPGRCDDRSLCWAGDARTEPYLATKGLVLAHARAFRLWEKHGRPGSGCGITLNGDWMIPFTSSEADKAAAQRALEYMAPPFADPIHFGKWPAAMETNVGSDRLPAWTDEEVELVNGSHDGNFFMNSYTSNFVRAPALRGNCGWNCDQGVERSGYNWTSGAAIGTPSSNGWLFNYGPGLGELVNWYHERYPRSSFVITENGWGSASNNMEVEMEVDDFERCIYYHDYIGNLSAMVARKGIDVKAYFAWSLMDNYEWADGFSMRFGLTYVDYATGKRTPKGSARWFQEHITSLSSLPSDGKPLPPCGKPLLGEAEAVILT